MKTITLYGERWDSLSYDLTHSAGNITALMLANPELAEEGDVILPEGIEVTIPEIVVKKEVETVQITAPWKR